MTDTNDNNIPDPAIESRQLLRHATTGALATLHHKSAVPYASLAAVASTPAGEPIVLLSDLAVHTKNLKAEPKASLLLARAPDNSDVLDNPRVTLMGVLEVCDSENDKARYIRRFPEAEQYAGFADFAFYRLAVDSAHYVGGFGRIHGLKRAQIVSTETKAGEITPGEASIIEHMNDDHADALGRMARGILGAPAGGWQMIGCDTAGCDLRCDDQILRLDFPEIVETLTGMRKMLANLARQADAA